MAQSYDTLDEDACQEMVQELMAALQEIDERAKLDVRVHELIERFSHIGI
jgi:hypothetical protein